MDVRWLVVLTILGAGPVWHEAAPFVRFVAYGDSLTMAFQPGDGDRPDLSWAAGHDPTVASVATRLAQTGVRVDAWNQAVSGAMVQDLAGQVQNGPQNATTVFVWAGVNDVCATNQTVSEFSIDVGQAFAVILAAHPDARVTVLAIPDVERLAAASRGSALGDDWTWCHAFYRPGDPESVDAERQRIAGFQNVLHAAAAANGFRFSDATWRLELTADDISADHVHPTAAGEARIAASVWQDVLESQRT